MISCRAHSLRHNCASLAVTVMLSDASFLAGVRASPALRWLIHTNSDSPVHHQNLLILHAILMKSSGVFISEAALCGSPPPPSPLTACEAAQSRNGKRKFNMASPRSLISIQMRHYWICRARPRASEWQIPFLEPLTFVHGLHSFSFTH